MSLDTHHGARLHSRLTEAPPLDEKTKGSHKPLTFPADRSTTPCVILKSRKYSYGLQNCLYCLYFGNRVSQFVGHFLKLYNNLFSTS